MHVEGSEELAVSADAQLLCSGDSVIDGLPGKLLHLNVVELPEVAEPLYQLGSYAAVKLESEMREGLARFRKTASREIQFKDILKYANTLRANFTKTRLSSVDLIKLLD